MGTHTREDAVSSLFCAECVWLVDVIESLCVDVIVTVVLGLLAGELLHVVSAGSMYQTVNADVVVFMQICHCWPD